MSKKMKPLLTIAIPTYNRGIHLDKGLQRILPQIFKYKNEIEFIISDNASTDNTQKVIKKYKDEYSEIDIITNLQSYNTGYFGNFKKCRELSSGKYFWILSDHEHVLDGVIDFLITTMHSDEIDVGVYFLAEESKNSLNKLENNSNTFKKFHTNFNNLVTNETAWLLTGISSMVFLNDKRYDDKVLLELKENLFLGFIFLCNALRIDDNITIINGKIYDTKPCNVYFDVFAAWTFHILDCVKYMLEIKLLNYKTKEIFIAGYLKTNVKNHIISYRKGIKIGKHDYTLNEIRTLIDTYYKHNKIYKKRVKLYLFSPYIIFCFLLFGAKLKRKINKLYFFVGFH